MNINTLREILSEKFTLNKSRMLCFSQIILAVVYREFYHKTLELNPNDGKAKNELSYIEKSRDK